MSEIKGSGTEAPGASETYRGIIDFLRDSFAKVYDLSKDIPAVFAFDMMDSNLNLRDSTKIEVALNLGEIGSLLELLWRAYENAIGDTYLKRIETNEEFMKIISDLLSIYRGFKLGEISEERELVMRVNGVAENLRDFFFKFMKSLS